MQTTSRFDERTRTRVRHVCHIALVIVFLLTLTACSNNSGNSAGADAKGGKGGRGGGGNAQNRPTPVGVATTESRDVPVILTGLGTITPYNTVTVRSRVDGQLVKVNFKEGQLVKEGQLLAVVDPRPFQVALQQAEAALSRDTAQYNSSSLDLKRYETLAQQGIVAQQQLDQQRAQTGQLTGTLKVDQANIENAKLNLTYTNITAPVSGRVGLRLVDPGNIVHANDQNGMLVITQIQPIAVLFTLPEDQIPQVVSRMRSGKLPVDAYDQGDQTKLASGRLETLDNQIDPTTGTVRLKAVFDNRDAVLWPNQFVNVHLQLQTLQHATVVPSAAVQRGQQGTYVYTVDENKKAQLAYIKVALTQGDTTVVASGLDSGQTVVVDGQDRLQAGSPVEPTAAPGGRRGRNQNASSEPPNSNGQGSGMTGPGGGPGAPLPGQTPNQTGGLRGPRGANANPSNMPPLQSSGGQSHGEGSRGSGGRSHGQAGVH